MMWVTWVIGEEEVEDIDDDEEGAASDIMLGEDAREGGERDEEGSDKCGGQVVSAKFVVTSSTS